MTELEPVALHRARDAFNRKWADMSSPFPTEEPEAGDGPIGYAIRAYLEAAPANAELEPVAWRWAWKTTGSELEQRFADPDLYEWTYRDTPPSEGAAPKMDVEPLVTLSSAQSAIAEARDKALEEAAKVADAAEAKWMKIKSLTVYEERYGASMAEEASEAIAKAVRALKEKP